MQSDLGRHVVDNSGGRGIGYTVVAFFGFTLDILRYHEWGARKDTRYRFIGDLVEDRIGD